MPCRAPVTRGPAGKSLGERDLDRDAGRGKAGVGDRLGHMNQRVG
jgi:hypothetical protein